MSGEPICVDVFVPIPALGARPGDVLVIRPEHTSAPITLTRSFGAEYLAKLRHHVDALAHILDQCVDPPPDPAPRAVPVLRVHVGGAP